MKKLIKKSCKKLKLLLNKKIFYMKKSIDGKLFLNFKNYTGIIINLVY